MQAKLARLSCGLRKGSLQIVEIGKSEAWPEDLDPLSPRTLLLQFKTGRRFTYT